MTRSALALMITVVLLVQSLYGQHSPDNTVQQSIASLPANAHVMVRFTDGNTIRGRIVNSGNDSFVLEPDNGGAQQRITYAQVSSVERVKSHTTRKWIIIGAVAAVAAVGITAAVILHLWHTSKGPGF